jgi:hypothetical protein
MSGWDAWRLYNTSTRWDALVLPTVREVRYYRDPETYSSRALDAFGRRITYSALEPTFTSCTRSV